MGIMFATLERGAHLIGVYIERFAGELGITQAEADVLAELHREGPSQTTTLHREFGHKRSTLTNIIDRLEQRGLINRQPNPDDRRLTQDKIVPETSSSPLRSREARSRR